MSSSAEYKEFIANLQGYTSVRRSTFTSCIYPLSQSLEWDGVQTTYVKNLIADGCGDALIKLCGAEHSTLAHALSAGNYKPLLISYTKLTTLFRGLILTATNAGWGAARYRTYIDSLKWKVHNSTEPPTTIVGMLQGSHSIVLENALNILENASCATQTVVDVAEYMGDDVRRWQAGELIQAPPEKLGNISEVADSPAMYVRCVANNT